MTRDDLPNIPEGLFKAVERALDERSAWIARPDRASTEAALRAIAQEANHD